MSNNNNRQSRFMRSMTPSGSIKMSTSRFNLVCGKTVEQVWKLSSDRLKQNIADLWLVEQAVRPNLDRVPNPQPPKILDARVLTPSLSRRQERGRSATRDNYGRPPVPPTRDSSLYIPFGSYAERGIHARPGRYASTSSAPLTNPRRSMTPGPGLGSSYTSQVHKSTNI